MKNKIFLVLMFFSLLLFVSSCAGNQNVVEMNSGNISQKDFYEELMKDSEFAEDTLYSMIFDMLSKKNNHKKVTKDVIEKEYQILLKEYSSEDELIEILRQEGLTLSDFKDDIKSELMRKEMLYSYIVLDELSLQQEFEKFHPKIESQIIKLNSKNDAEEALKDINSGIDFESVAKEKSTEIKTANFGGYVTFDSTMMTKPEYVYIPEDIKNVAYGMEDNTISDIIVSENIISGKEEFFIIKVIKKEEKGKDYKKFEKELIESIRADKVTDTDFILNVLRSEAEKSSLEIHDDRVNIFKINE